MSATIGDAQNRKTKSDERKKTLLSLTRAYRLSRYCSCVNTPPLCRLVQFDSRIVCGLFVLVYLGLKHLSLDPNPTRSFCSGSKYMYLVRMEVS